MRENLNFIEEKDRWNCLTLYIWKKRSKNIARSVASKPFRELQSAQHENYLERGKERGWDPSL